MVTERNPYNEYAGSDFRYADAPSQRLHVHAEGRFHAFFHHTAIAEVLKQEGYIADYVVEGETKKVLKITMKYFKRQPVIENLQRVSKPSCRLYCGSQNIPKVKDGMGIAILSTSRGVLSGKDAEKQNVGGEILCYVW